MPATSSESLPAGRLTAISGSVVHVDLDRDVMLGEVMLIGEERLLGEVVELENQSATLQVYEDTGGLASGAPVFATGQPFAVELGPGLLGSVFDGTERPLPRLAETQGNFLGRGQQAPALDCTGCGSSCLRSRLATRFAAEAPSAPCKRLPRSHIACSCLRASPAASSTSSPLVVTCRRCRRLARRGRWIAPASHAVSHVAIGGRPRPFAERLPPTMPMLTGQRVLDTSFPLPRGGAAGCRRIRYRQDDHAAPALQVGDADVIVYVGCGERGNEMTEMLTKLPKLVDPRSGHPLGERTVLVANTSNMPVPAREASIYTGVTIAEYYRDMGYHVALLADSTSRWAEALREISGRLGEMPAEEAYPSYLSSRLASYYERAGRVRTLGGLGGLVTLISAISPPGGDLTEPVTRHTQRFTQCFWTLDKARAEARMFPAISLRESYSHLPAELDGLVDHGDVARVAAAQATSLGAPRRCGPSRGDGSAHRNREPARAAAVPARDGAALRRRIPAAERVRPGGCDLLPPTAIPPAPAAASRSRARIAGARTWRDGPGNCESAGARASRSRKIRDWRRRAGGIRRIGGGRRTGVRSSREGGAGVMTNLGGLEYRGLTGLRGPLAFVQGIAGVAFHEHVYALSPDGGTTAGRVLAVAGDTAVIEVFGTTEGLTLTEARVRFQGSPLKFGVGRELLGRIYDGMGRPCDGLPPPLVVEERAIEGAPVNPVRREFPVTSWRPASRRSTR